MNQTTVRHPDETSEIYTGSKSPRWSPILAGISQEFPTCKMQRPSGDFYTFEYILNGKGTIRQDEMIYKVSEGDAYILRQGHFHQSQADARHPWRKVFFHVTGSLVRHLLADYNLDSTVVISGYGNSDHLMKILNTLQKDPSHSGDQIALILFQYIQALSSHIQSPLPEDNPARRMKDFIDQNLNTPLTIDTIAAHVHLSRSRAFHIFKDEYGIPPYNYYVKLRLELAQTMLQNTQLTVSEISEQLGFASIHHLSSFFKRYTDMSPTQYRKKNT